MSETVVKVLLVILAVVVELLLARWVARDAFARGMNPVRWGLIVFCSTFVGLAIYLWLRQNVPER
ncbi:MAG: hypothetical protein JSV84_01050 [Gemmatimonadota bacterium]|nr:MAG: hypothetical protein JSV84_01050 [Gemmatimonadota bacterium]